MGGRFKTERDLSSIHPKHTGIPTWGRFGRCNFHTRQKTKFHQTV